MALSSLPMKINVGTLMRLRRYAVILTRIIVGLTFVVAGWAKAIDPWGFVIKMGEYFSAWGLAIPHERWLRLVWEWHVWNFVPA